MNIRRVVAGLALVVAGAAAGIVASCRHPALDGSTITLTVAEATIALEGLDDAIAVRGDVFSAENSTDGARIVAARQGKSYAGLSAIIETRLRALDNQRSYTDDELRATRSRPE